MKLVDFDSLKVLILFVLFLVLSGCPHVTFVQPYDADLYSNTELFYKKSSAVIAKGVSASPKTNEERDAITDSEIEKHPGHYNQFKGDYSSLLIDANSLILRALANSSDIDSKAHQVQTKIENAITKSFPDKCDDVQEEFSEVSLTARNYIDLKCLIGKWESQHNSKDISGQKLILKESNWEARSKSLFQGILAIQKAEAAKKDD